MPSIDIVHLLDMVVVNVLACNTDAHAKNYAIIIRGNGASIAPMYDLMSGDREKALAAGCDDFDTKPVEMPRLLEKISAFKPQ